MAPRKQTKQAAESVAVADANGDATPPKKRKIAVTAAAKVIAEEPKQARGGLRRAKAEKHEADEKQAITNEASPPKKARLARNRNVAASPKASGRTGRKINKPAEVTENNNAREQVVEKKAARAKNGAMTKKAGTKEQAATKMKAKASPAKRQRNDAGGDTRRKNAVARPPAKKTRAKTVEKESVAPAARTAAKAPKKRKSPEHVNEGTKVTEAGDAHIAEGKETVPEKKSRSRAKKQVDNERKL